MYLTLVIGCMACGSGLQPDAYIEGTDIPVYCEGYCPDSSDIRVEITRMGKLFEGKIEQEPLEVFKHWRFVFSDVKNCRAGYQFAQVDDSFDCRENGLQPVYGLTSYNAQEIWVYTKLECPEYKKGLCPGVFHYELGNVLTGRVKHFSNEREKILYRCKNKLLHPYQTQDELDRCIETYETK